MATRGRKAFFDYLPFHTGQKNIKIVMLPEVPVRGRVIDDATGQGVGGVKLELRGAGVAEITLAQTDDEGDFAFHGLRGGRFVLTYPRGFRGEVTSPVKQIRFLLEPGRPLPPLVTSTIEGGQLALTFVDHETGQPIKGLRGISLYLSPFPPRDPLTPGQADLSFDLQPRMEDGQFKTIVRPGTYALYLHGSPIVGHRKPREPFEKEITVLAGRTTAVTVPLMESPTIKGVVVDPAGAPVPDAEIKLRADGYVGSALTDSHGRFAIHLPEIAQYDSKPVDSLAPEVFVLARCPKQNLTAMLKVQNITAPLRVKLTQGAALTGILTDAADTPIAGRVHVELYPSDDQDDDRLVMSISDRGFSAPADSDGRYVLFAVPRGVRWYLAAGADGFGDTRTKGVADELIVEIEPIVLTRADKSISGIVVDDNGKPVTYADVTVITVGQNPRFAITDAAGRFAVDHLLPRELRVVAGANIDEGRFFVGEARVKAGDKSIRIKLRRAREED